ncbi:sucrose synthase [Myxacorys almedinensis]|uniref:Sucrose synthase n=1 Tax=Myxacorys almedinensis A TaxID=2690445 RepID=A0A8J7ZAY4_9CYAN|nr:sucrose synthase [Myxacorys almedinensis]NDJ18645.1 sucrose synthase [Myxacorys almedinensis A]
MYQLIQSVLHDREETRALHQVIAALIAAEDGVTEQMSARHYFLHNDILRCFEAGCQQQQKPAHFYHSSAIGRLIHCTHELILEGDDVWFVLRPWIGSQQIWRFDRDLTTPTLMTPSALLDARDRWVGRYQPNLVELDLSSFYKNEPSISDPRSIGQGVAFLNRYLAHQVSDNPQYWLQTTYDVLSHQVCDGIPLMLNDRIQSGEELVQQVKAAIKFLGTRSRHEAYELSHPEMQALGFEPGWGNSAGRAQETLELLDYFITTPEPAILEAFVARFPSVFRVTLVSIHGWIGQQNVVLGRPETLGQVVYVLEQARALEKALHEEIRLAGLEFLGIQPHIVILTRLIPNCEGTQCELPVEQVDGTQNAWILRVPFREFNPKVTENWISKFEIAPYLEPFAIDAEAALVKHLGGRPNLIIGNYSDGNLVAFLLSRRLNVTHCNIAHVLEKPKHLFSNLYWHELEPQYHFSSQFTADLISMNAADFVVTSSYQEIVGTPDTLGQYESYKHFTMPGLYHVLDGVDLFSPKFNRIPPGVDEAVFFPYSDKQKRSNESGIWLNELVFVQEEERILGKLDDPTKRPILSLAPITVSKNLTGLVQCFAEHPELQARCNLILVTNKLQVDEAASAEEAEQIQKLHGLIERHQLHGKIRWVGIRLSVRDMGEMYRVIADRRGIFIHFALFEAFGRTILEAMVSGLPTFATEFGGPAEIIEDDKYGFLINPTNYSDATRKMIEFLDRCDADPSYWQEVSDRGIQRVHDDYTWQLHTKQLLLSTKLYSFWNYLHRNDRESLLRYLELIFHLIFKPRAATILENHMSRER